MNDKPRLLIVVVWLVGLGLCQDVLAQTGPILEGSNIRPFAASGSIGLSANMYNAWGIENRRAPAMAQANANVNFNLFGLSSGMDLLYNTDQSGLRQNINTISFNATWEWLTLQAGDVSPNFSKFGINGATIRGGYVKAEPGNWQFEFSGGRSRRRVEPSLRQGFREPSYKRLSFAGKIGYETENNHYYLSSHYSVDDNHSFNNPGDITPQENLTVTPDIKYTLFDQALVLTAQLTASAFTRDLNAPEIKAGAVGIPSFFTGIMSAHTSTRLNYAGEVAAELSMDSYGLGIGYERIQPGFTSLGVGKIRDDWQQVRISPSAQFLDNRLSVQSNLVIGRDNLSGSRLQTQRNTTLGANMQFSASEKINISANYNLLVNDVSSGTGASPQTPGVALGQTQVAHTIMLQPTLTLQKEDLTHSISLSESYYTLSNNFKGKQSGLAQKINSDTYSTALNYALSFNGGFSFNAMGNFLVNTSNTSKNTSFGANLGASYSLLDRKLTLNFNGGFNQNKNKSGLQGQNTFITKSRQLMLNLMGNYQLSSHDSFSLSIRNRNSSVLKGGNNTYSELEASLNYRHRF